MLLVVVALLLRVPCTPKPLASLERAIAVTYSLAALKVIVSPLWVIVRALSGPSVTVFVPPTRVTLLSLVVLVEFN